MKLFNKKAVITGGSSGIGLAISKEFLNEGASVGIIGRDTSSLENAISILNSDKVDYFEGNVASAASLEEAYAKIAKKNGSWDILVVNAGIFKPTPLRTASETDIDELFDINLKGAFFSIQKALPYINKGGSIIIISSISALQGSMDFSIYNASKAGVRSLCQSVAAELLSEQIKVNSISPGCIRTHLQEKIGIGEELISLLEQSIPLKRFGLPHEVAKIALLLASTDSSYMTGADIVVDGGLANLAPPF